VNSKTAKYGSNAALLLIVVTLLVLSWLTVDVEFPTFEYASRSLRRQLVPAEPYSGIAALVSRFMWEQRALDLTGQAFVIVAAVICCLALLKSMEEGN